MTVHTTQTQPGSWAQLPDLTLGVNRYFEFLQRQIKLTGELTATWALTMNTMSATALANAQVGRSSATERTLGGSVRLPPLINARITQPRTHSVSEPEPEPNDRPVRQEPRPADVFDEVIEILIDDDIIAAISE